MIEPGSIIPLNIVTAGNSQTIFLEWRLADNSAPAARYVVAYQGDDGEVSLFFSVETTRNQFINLVTGTGYTFTIIAISDTGPPVRSPPVSQFWIAGDNTRKY